MDTKKIVLVFCVAIAFELVNGAAYPKNFPRCKAGDNECLPAVITEVLKKVKDGNAEMNLPPIEPLRIPQINIISGKQSAVAIELYFKDCYFHGISDAIINKTVGFESDPKNSKYEIHARIPRLEMIARYKVDGKVMILPIKGSGASNLTLENVDIKVKFRPNVIEKGDGKTYLQIPNNKFKMVFDTSRLYLNLENLFNNKALSDNMNNFLNENWQGIFSELKPSVRDTLAQILSDMVNSVFENLPYEDLFSNTVSS